MVIPFHRVNSTGEWKKMTRSIALKQLCLVVGKAVLVGGAGVLAALYLKDYLLV